MRPVQATATGSKLSVCLINRFYSRACPDQDTYTILAKSPGEPTANKITAKKITALRIDALRHESFPKNSLSFSDSGNFVLTEIEVRLVNKNDSDDGSTPTEPVRIVSAEATYEQGSHSVTNAFDGNRGTGWAVYEGWHVDRDHAAVFRLKTSADRKRPDLKSS